MYFKVIMITSFPPSFPSFQILLYIPYLLANHDICVDMCAYIFMNIYTYRYSSIYSYVCVYEYMHAFYIGICTHICYQV